MFQKILCLKGSLKTILYKIAKSKNFESYFLFTRCRQLHSKQKAAIHGTQICAIFKVLVTNVKTCKTHPFLKIWQIQR